MIFDVAIDRLYRPVFFEDAEEVDGEHFLVGELGLVVVAQALGSHEEVALVVVTDVEIEFD